MNTTLLILVVLAVGLTVQIAHAEPFPRIEYGPNYDKQYLGLTSDGQAAFRYGTTPERLLDYTDQYGIPHYINYKIRDDPDNVYFESAKTSYVFNKNTCTFEMHDGGKLDGIGEKMTLSHTIKEAVNGTDLWYAASENNQQCSYSLSEQNGLVQLTAIKGDFKTVYDIDYATGFEWTYKYKNTKTAKTDHKYGFTVVCDGPQCDNIKINEQVLSEPVKLKEDLLSKKIKVGEHMFDPKNEEHDYLWALKKENNKMIVDFTHSKGRLPVGDELIVDPTFSIAGANSGRIRTTATNAAFCSQVYSSTSSNFFAYQPLEGANDECQYAITQFNISSLAGKTISVSAAFIEIDVDVEDNTKDCQVRRLSTDITTVSQIDLTDAQGGTVLVSSDADCNTTGNDKALNFGSNMTDIATAVLAGTTNYAVGISCPPAWDRPSAGGRCNFEFSDASLNFTYTLIPPAQPTSFTGVSQARKVQFDWTTSSGTGTTGYYIGRSLDNSTWPSANKTLVGNVTTYLDTSYWRINQLYYVNITATNGANSTARYSSLTTDTFPSAPLNPYTTGLSDTSIKINWSPPSSTGNDPITGYRIQYCLVCTSWTTLTNNTNTYNYNHTGLSGGSTPTYRMAAWNGVALGTYTANFTGSTFEPTSGSISLESGVVGDVIQLNGTITISAGSPEPINISQSRFYVNGVLTETRAEDIDIDVGDSETLEPFWYQFTSAASRIFSIKVTASNSTGTVTLSPISNVTTVREYDPDYFTAIDPAEGLVNSTVSRSDDQDTVLIKINRDRGGATFNIECLLQTQQQAAFEPTSGTWINRSGTGYYNASISGFDNEPLYGTCWNSGELLTFQSYSNGSLILFGISAFDNTYGEFLGVPVGVFFIVMLAGAASQRTAPTWIVILLAVAGVMATIGFFELDTNTWALSLVAGLLGLIVGRKFF